MSEKIQYPTEPMRMFLVVTWYGRRFVVGARDKDRAAAQIEDERSYRCAWTGEVLDVWEGHVLREVVRLGTLVGREA